MGAPQNRPEHVGTTTERLIQLAEVVRGIAEKLKDIEEKIDRVNDRGDSLANRIAHIETTLAVQEQHNRHQDAQYRRLDRLVSKVLWTVFVQILTLVGGLIAWLVTRHV